MVSTTAIGIFLYLVSFAVIALHALREYLKDKQDSKKKHVFYAFASVSIAFVFDLISALLVSPDISPARVMVVSTLIRLFDAFNVIGLFWLFIFLKDFMPQLKTYIIPVFAHLMVTLIVIFVTPAGVTMFGGEPIMERAEIRDLAIIFFWFLYWSLIAYEFWKNSKLMTKKIAIRRSQMMSAGGIFAVLAYVAVIFSGLYSAVMFVFIGEIFAITAGVVFYAGFVAPNWLKRRWMEN